MMKILYKPIILFCLFIVYAGILRAQNSQLPSWAFGPFLRPAGVNPLISPDTTTRFFDPMRKVKTDWESNDTFNPAATIKNGKICILYRAEDKSGTGIGGRTSRLGFAVSRDGVTVIRSSVPVLYPADDSQREFEWTGGCEDPRIAMTKNGTYVVFYTQWNHDLPRLGVATSKDLKTWTKHGPIFRYAYNGRFHKIASKSASIITKLVNGKQVIAKIGGRYWMYWGETGVYAATSTDLINWKPLINPDSTLKALISPRRNYFDSDLTECGPPAIITSKGIVLLYNGKNNAVFGDKHYTANSYCGGQVMFSASDPTRAISRLDKPFFIPQESFEKSGQYPAGTVFMEGLVFFHSKWFLYYGCADSRVGVAIYQPSGKVNKQD